MKPHQHPRLVSTSRLRKGLVRLASSSDGIVDVAAAVELGLIDDEGIVALIPTKTRIRALKLLQSNVLFPITLKKKSLVGTHLKAKERKLAGGALATVIGPIYREAKEKGGISLGRAMDRSMFAKWVKAEIENDSSYLNKQLTYQGFFDICGLKRSAQWWMRLLSQR